MRALFSAEKAAVSGEISLMVKGGFVIAVVGAAGSKLASQAVSAADACPCGLHLPQRDADAGPAVAIAGDRRGRLPRPVPHRRTRRLIASDCGIAEGGHHPLKASWWRVASNGRASPSRRAPDAAGRDARRESSPREPARSPDGCGRSSAASAAHGCAAPPGSCPTAAGSADRPRCGRAG